MARASSNGVLYLLVFVSFTYWMTFLTSPIFPLYVVHDLGASTLVLGLVMSISSFCSIIFRVPFGMLADRIGRWRMLSIALSITGVSFLLYYLAPTYVWLFPIGILRAIARSSFLPAASAVASNIAPSSKERGKIMGIYMTSISSALVLGPLLSSYLLEFLNFRQIFLIVTLIAFSGVVIALVKGAQVRKAGYDIVKQNRSVTGSFSVVLRSRNMIALYLTMPTLFFTAGVFSTLFSVYANETLLLSPSLISFLFAVRGLTDTFTRIPAGYISDRVGRKWPLIFSLSLIVVTFICISVLNFAVIVFGFVIYGIAFGIRTVTMSALAGDSVPPEDIGLTMAFLFATTDAGSSIGSIFAGAASIVLPSASIFQIAALILCVTTPILWFVKENADKPSLR